MGARRTPRATRPPAGDRMKRIKDPVHDLILVEPYALDLLDQPTMQRLRGIRQTGTAHLVYPGANHTRFEHSLGAHHLAQVAASSLGLSPHEAQVVGAAALLHDVGHGPFSHLSEVVIEETTGRSHEEFTVARVGNELAPALERHGIDPKEVIQLVSGRHRLTGLISGPLDVDRIDYLLRDGHYTGVATSVDALRLMATVTLHEGRIVTQRSGLGAAEGLLVTRFAMQSAVYYHHTCRAGELLLQRAMFELVSSGEIAGEDLARFDDADLVALLRHHGGLAGDLGRRVFERRLTKVAFEVPYQALEDRWVATYSGNRKKLRELEETIADAAGVPVHHVHADAPAPPTLPEVEAAILLPNGEVRSLPDVSTLVRALADAHQDHWHFRVYTPAESRAEVAKAAPKAVALEKSLDEFV